MQPQHHLPEVPDPHSFVQSFHGGESGQVVIPLHWWTDATWFLLAIALLLTIFILSRKAWTLKEKIILTLIAASIFSWTFPQSLRTRGQIRIAFKQDYTKPIYWVNDLTDSRAAIYVNDSDYLHASSVVLKGMPGHVIWYRVAAR